MATKTITRFADLNSEVSRTFEVPAGISGTDEQIMLTVVDELVRIIKHWCSSNGVTLEKGNIHNKINIVANDPSDLKGPTFLGYLRSETLQRTAKILGKSQKGLPIDDNKLAEMLISDGLEDTRDVPPVSTEDLVQPVVPFNAKEVYDAILGNGSYKSQYHQSLLGATDAKKQYIADLANQTGLQVTGDMVFAFPKKGDGALYTVNEVWGFLVNAWAKERELETSQDPNTSTSKKVLGYIVRNTAELRRVLSSTGFAWFSVWITAMWVDISTTRLMFSYSGLDPIAREVMSVVLTLLFNLADVMEGIFSTRYIQEKANVDKASNQDEGEKAKQRMNAALWGKRTFFWVARANIGVTAIGLVQMFLGGNQSQSAQGFDQAINLAMSIALLASAVLISVGLNTVQRLTALKVYSK